MFREMSRYLSFAIKLTRYKRLEVNKLAIASEVFVIFMENCIENCNPGDNKSIDKYLFPIYPIYGIMASKRYNMAKNFRFVLI